MDVSIRALMKNKCSTLRITLQKKKAAKDDSDDSDDMEDMDSIMSFSAAGKKGGKKKTGGKLSAFQLLDVEEPDVSEVLKYESILPHE